jgi:hypothetical protein
MRDDRSDEDLEGFPADDPTSTLERLDAGFEDLDVPDEPSPSGSPLSQRQIDDLVDQVLGEELARLPGTKKK